MIDFVYPKPTAGPYPSTAHNNATILRQTLVIDVPSAMDTPGHPFFILQNAFRIFIPSERLKSRARVHRTHARAHRAQSLQGVRLPTCVSGTCSTLCAPSKPLQSFFRCHLLPVGATHTSSKGSLCGTGSDVGGRGAVAGPGRTPGAAAAGVC